jgi:hypothetical protein
MTTGYKLYYPVVIASFDEQSDPSAEDIEYAVESVLGFRVRLKQVENMIRIIALNDFNKYTGRVF